MKKGIVKFLTFISTIVGIGIWFYLPITRCLLYDFLLLLLLIIAWVLADDLERENSGKGKL
jgi:hypothetical protein